MADWALVVKMTDPLVATAGSALENYPWWTCRELKRTSGIHFSEGLDFLGSFLEILGVRLGP